MGLVSFLTRRNADRRPGVSATGSASVASLPPVQSAHGNGSFSAEPLQREATRKRSQPLLSNPVKPYFLGVRTDDDGPSAGPGDDPDDRRPRGLPLPAASVAPSVRSVATGRSKDSAPRPGVANHYVDLLDAQSGIKPYDFKTRIRAAGTRDFGEDVAERNMRREPPPLPSPRPEPGHRLSRSVVTMAAFAALPEQPAKWDRKRNVSLSVTTPDEPPARTRTFDSRTLLSLAAPAPERTLSERGRRRRMTDAGGLSRRPPRDPAARGLAAAEGRSPSGVSRSRSSSRSASPPPVPRYRQRNIQPSSASNGDRSRSRGVGSDYRACTPRAAPRKGDRGREQSVEAVSLHPNISYAAARQQDGRAFREAALPAESSDEWPLSDAAPAPRIKSSGRHQDTSRGRTRRRQGAQPQWKSPWSQAGQPERPNGLAHSRNESGKSASSRSRAFGEFTGCVPDRKSSLKQWSISSVTATTVMSDYSSIPPARSRSAHTADTSVDLPLSAALAKPADMSSPPVTSNSLERPDSSPYVTALEDDVCSDTTAASPAWDKGQLAGARSGLEIRACGYGSTDDSDDSFAKKRREAQDDESLLFKDGGFGDLGDNLPGLSDSTAQAPCLICSMLRGVGVKPSADVAESASWGPRDACAHKGITTRRDRLRALGYAYDTDDSGSESDGVRRGRARTQPTAAAAGARHRVPAEQREARAAPEKPRQATASRSGGRGRARSRGTKPARGACEGACEDGHAADVE